MHGGLGSGRGNFCCRRSRHRERAGESNQRARRCDRPVAPPLPVLGAGCDLRARPAKPAPLPPCASRRDAHWTRMPRARERRERSNVSRVRRADGPQRCSAAVFAASLRAARTPTSLARYRRSRTTSLAGAGGSRAARREASDPRGAELRGMRGARLLHTRAPATTTRSTRARERENSPLCIGTRFARVSDPRRASASKGHLTRALGAGALPAQASSLGRVRRRRPAAPRRAPTPLARTVPRRAPTPTASGDRHCDFPPSGWPDPCSLTRLPARGRRGSSDTSPRSRPGAGAERPRARTALRASRCTSASKTSLRRSFFRAFGPVPAARRLLGVHCRDPCFRGSSRWLDVPERRGLLER